MSYDLMVFRIDAAPRKRTEFMEWYENETEWKEEHSYDDPVNTSFELRNWFLEMIQTFPALNGPYSSDDNDTLHVSDYCVGKDIIYVGFSWSLAEEAYVKMLELAEKHGVGFFDVSSENGVILFPKNGKIIPMNQSISNLKNLGTNKRWWKFW